MLQVPLCCDPASDLMNPDRTSAVACWSQDVFCNVEWVFARQVIHDRKDSCVGQLAAVSRRQQRHPSTAIYWTYNNRPSFVPLVQDEVRHLCALLGTLTESKA